MRSLGRLVNKRVVQLQERFFRNSYVVGQPFHLVLETGNRCNLKCPLCPTPFRENRIPTGRLRFEDARRIIDQLPRLLHVNLSLWGEPLLNKDIFRIISYVHARDVEVLLQSNLNVLNEEMAEQLVDSGLDILQISLDGASQEAYEKYRVGGDFANVIRNIERVKAVQQRRGASRLQIVWKMVVHRYNEHEVPRAREWARELGVEFKVVEIYAPRQLHGVWKPREGVVSSAEVHSDAVSRCYSLWQVLTVNFNGDVFPCCSEFSPQDALGNILQEPLRKVWNNARFRSLRKRNRGAIDCQPCHRDKETRWYESWMAGSEPQARGPASPLLK
jgi:radical SAM protein with 4Fe4S-binding SPASM domain